MNVEQIEAFIYVAMTGSFSKAGEILFLSQPTVSAKIKSLEEELGGTLFERTGKNVYLSEEGKAFLPYAQNTLKNIQKGISSVQKTNNTFDGELPIGFVFSGASYLLPKIFNDFYEKYPKIKLVAYTGHSDQVLKMVLEHEVSIGIVRSVFHPDIESISLIRDEMVVVFHQDHSFGKKQNLTIQEVAKTPFILFKRETLDWTLINNAFKKANLSPNIIVEVDSIEGAKQMVKKNIGVSILPRFAIQDELESNTLKTATIPEIPIIYRHFNLISLKGSTLGPTAKKFSQFIQNFYRFK
ncbi:MAG TPA: LysR family transcriptional regulator [Bacillales bacterium]